MSTPLYNKYKEQAHVFIFSVCGRASSTALQRILNSTQEIIIWGESSAIFERTFIHLEYLEKVHQKNAKIRDQHHKLLVEAIQKKEHTAWYPKAGKNLSLAINQQYEFLAHQLMPPTDHIHRFGFKEIAVYRKNLLPIPARVFPNCYYVFLFRHPFEQWVSVKESQYFPYSKELSLFLKFYKQFATNYLRYYQTHEHGIFVQNEILFSHIPLQHLMNELDLPHFDKHLIGNITHSFQKGQLSEEEKETILNSDAYQLFLTMQDISNRFFSHGE